MIHHTLSNQAFERSIINLEAAVLRKMQDSGLLFFGKLRVMIRKIAGNTTAIYREITELIECALPNYFCHILVHTVKYPA